MWLLAILACSSVLAVVLSHEVIANSPPVVSNIRASQRDYDTNQVDIYYNLADPNNDACAISVEISANGGTTWEVSAASFSGDIGIGITPDVDRHIVWDCVADIPGAYGTEYKVRLTADDGQISSIGPVEFVSIPGKTWQMSKREITNQQYCDYLNAAYPADVNVVGGIVYSSDDSGNSEPFFNTFGASSNSQIDFSGDLFSVRSKDGSEMSNYPVVFVSWYGCNAFCSYYGYRLPTEWEWEYAARGGLSGMDYPWGNIWDDSRGNCWDSGDAYEVGSYPWTSPVDNFSAQNNYGLYDMAGNVSEWTSSCYNAGCSPEGLIVRGGGWGHYAADCRVTGRSYGYPDDRTNDFGFRVVLDH
jgi:formylglycine-generating enzyme required for sulfatase activity